MRAKKVRRAANVATLSGWTMAIFAAVTLASALFDGLVSLVLGIALAVVTYNELRGGAMIRRFEPAGAKRLGYNQIALGVLIVVYAGWSLIASLRSPLAAIGGSSGDPGVDEMVARISGWVVYGLYGGVAVVGVVAPGLTAWYYFTRERVVREMLAGTPPWVIAAMRATG